MARRDWHHPHAANAICVLRLNSDSQVAIFYNLIPFSCNLEWNLASRRELNVAVQKLEYQVSGSAATGNLFFLL